MGRDGISRDDSDSSRNLLESKEVTMDLVANLLTMFLLVFQTFGSCDGRIAQAKNPSGLAPYDTTFLGRYSDDGSTHFSGRVSRSRWHSENESRPADEERSPWSEKY